MVVHTLLKMVDCYQRFICIFVVYHVILEEPIFQLLNWEKPFGVHYYASRNVIGGTLFQLDESDHDHPIHFASKQ
jgi:hypothetical protein